MKFLLFLKKLFVKSYPPGLPENYEIFKNQLGVYRFEVAAGIKDSSIGLDRKSYDTARKDAWKEFNSLEKYRKANTWQKVEIK